ncbi:TM1266 family iron-only hydrogenase system putative regulator [Desulfocurvus sp. DL9XJH121]
MDKRIGIIGIIVGNRQASAPKVNELLTEFGDIIVGRLGMPFRERGMSVIGLIIEATTDELGALTGKLGMLEDVRVKSLMV